MKKSMKISCMVGCFVIGMSCFSSSVFGETDYSTMSNEEMAQARGTMRDAAQEDRDAFRSEWQERVGNMSQEERQNAVGRPDNALGDGNGIHARQGGGAGSGYGGSGSMDGSGRGRGRR